MRIIRAGGIELSEGMKLIGEAEEYSDIVKLTRAQASNDLVNCIIAVLHSIDDAESDNNPDSTVVASSHVPQHLIHSNVAGFVWVVQVDIDRDVLTVLAPCPGALPSKYLLLGNMKWVE